MRVQLQIPAQTVGNKQRDKHIYASKFSDWSSSVRITFAKFVVNITNRHTLSGWTASQNKGWEVGRMRLSIF